MAECCSQWGVEGERCFSPSLPGAFCPARASVSLRVHVLALRSGFHLLSAGYTKQKEDGWMQGLMVFLCLPRGFTEQTILN